jgi:hypothetical protein
MQIKDRLLIEDKRIEAFELRKNKDNNRKYNKQVQELRKSEGAAQRKKQISDVSNLRKESAADGQSKEDKVKQLIDGEPLTKSKKRVNMVRCCVAREQALCVQCLVNYGAWRASLLQSDMLRYTERVVTY